MTEPGGALDDATRVALLDELARARTGAGLDSVPAGLEAHRRSPTCGDEVRVRIAVGDDGAGIAALAWDGHGCVVSTAATSALAAVAPGLSLDAFAELAVRYRASVEPDGTPVAEGDLDVFAGIGRYPLRAGCATLAWRAALDALAFPTPVVE